MSATQRARSESAFSPWVANKCAVSWWKTETLKSLSQGLEASASTVCSLQACTSENGDQDNEISGLLLGEDSSQGWIKRPLAYNERVAGSNLFPSDESNAISPQYASVAQEEAVAIPRQTSSDPGAWPASAVAAHRPQAPMPAASHFRSRRQLHPIPKHTGNLPTHVEGSCELSLTGYRPAAQTQASHQRRPHGACC